MSNCYTRTLYVGNLPIGIHEKEVAELFYKYGPIVSIALKNPIRPPLYAFVEFKEVRAAEDAIRCRDGYEFHGRPLRVELTHISRVSSSSIDHYSSRDSRDSGGRGAPDVPKKSEFRVLVSGLPSSASWQDLKDHMRKAGYVRYTEVFRGYSGTTGIADYTNYDDMKYAVRNLDYSKFCNSFARRYVRVKEYSERDHSRSISRSRSYSRDRRSRSRGRSSTRSRSRSRSRSKSRSKSPKPKSSHRSPARSRSASPRPRSFSRCRLRSRSPLPPRKKLVSKSPKKRSPSMSRSPKKRSPSMSRSPKKRGPSRSWSKSMSMSRSLSR